LGALVVYPIFFTLLRSFYGPTGQGFVGVANYRRMFTSPDTLIAIKNNAIWVVVAPSVVTAIGLVFAVLTERVKWGTAFKVAIFMPMAISFLSAGVIWRLVYEGDPQRGLANAALAAVVEVFRPPGEYVGARPRADSGLENRSGNPDTPAYVTKSAFTPGGSALLGMVGIPASTLPASAEQARAAPSAAGTLAGTVWLDFTPGGGTPGVIDEGERGLPGMKMEALDGAKVVASASSGKDGVFEFRDLRAGQYSLRLASSNFRPAFGGFTWLGPALVTPAVIVSYVWIWAGFAMVLIAAGLAAIPRDVLEAARVDGANEWQVFRRVTAPLLWPVLLVVLVTLVINVLKVFDLVFVIPPASTQYNANVIALEMWRVSFGGGQNQGLGSALAVLLFLLVIPAMLFNIRRFRSEG
jgi:alpha-glucoside transport system permease protein